MDFCGFKTLLESIMSGDNKIMDNKNLIPLVNEKLREMAIELVPSSLITADANEKFLVDITGEYFLRKPVVIINNVSLIDIDDELHLALAYNIASVIGNSRNKDIYESRYREKTNNYRWERYRNIKDD